MRRKALLAAALALPLVVLAIGIVRGELHLAGARRWTFEVGGYDPRDLLQGRYLAFQLVLNEAEPIEACSDGEDCCFCLLDQGSGMPPRVQRASCPTARDRCDGMLRTGELSSLRRYYLSEEGAEKLTPAFQKAVLDRRASLVVAIDNDGRARADRMLIDGQPLESLLR